MGPRFLRHLTATPHRPRDEVSWDELRTAVPFALLVPEVPDGWDVGPGAAASAVGCVSLKVVDATGRLRVIIGQDQRPHDEPGRPERAEISVGSFTARWCLHFDDVPGATPVANVLASVGDVNVCGAGHESRDGPLGYD